MNNLINLAAEYKTELTERIVPFWLDHAPDRENGGHFSCLTGAGLVFDTDKFIWMQSRLVWTFSHLAGKSKSLLSDSVHLKCLKEAERGALFLLEKGRNKEGDWFFSVDQNGNPLVAAYNIFTDVFALMGLAEYAGLKGDVDTALQEQALNVAEETWIRILNRQNNPKGAYSKAASGARQFRPMNWPMIMLNMTQVLENTPLAERIGSDLLRTMRFKSAGDILEYHLDMEGQVLRERINPDGTFNNENMEGRLLNPGHACETLAFIIEAFRKDGSDLEYYLQNRSVIIKKMEAAGSDSIGMLIGQAVEWNLKKGWDREYGGIFYYMDILNLPVEKLEWSMKLWWVHLESAVAALSAYQLSGNDSLKEWFDKIHFYMWDKFRFSDSPEWYGYLSRQGTPSNDLAGGKWKGFFHLPRALVKMISLIESETQYNNRGISEKAV